MLSDWRAEQLFGLAALVLLVVGCVVVLWPFAAAISWALIIAVATWPLADRLRRALGGRRTLTAAVAVAALVLLVLLPLLAIGLGLVDSANAAANAVESFLRHPPAPPAWLDTIPLVGESAHRLWSDFAAGELGIGSALQPYVGGLGDVAIGTVTTLGADLFQVLMSLLVVFFLYRDGHSARLRLERFVGRVVGPRGPHLLAEAHGTTIGVLYGVLGTAIIQGTLTGMALWAAGIPGALFLGLFAIVLSVIPFGVSLVFIPSALWLVVSGQPLWAAAILVWGIFPVGALDGVLRPMFISTGTRLPYVLILLGVMGGALTMGLLGVFLGPVLLAIAFTLIHEWTTGQDETAPASNRETSAVRLDP